MERAWSTLRPALNDGAVNAPALVENQCRPKGKVAAGVAMIHQHFMRIEAMTVVENVMLGWSQAGWVLKRAEIAARMRETSLRFGLDLDPDAVIGEMPLGRRQRVVACGAIAGLGGAVLSLSRSEPFPE